jgi:hypothetical protein
MFPFASPDNNSAPFGCNATVVTAALDSYSLVCLDPCLASHNFTVPSSDPEYIHLPSLSNPIAVTFPWCPSCVNIGDGFEAFTSNTLIVGFPAAANICLSGEISSLFTCESWCCNVR